MISQLKKRVPKVLWSTDLRRMFGYPNLINIRPIFTLPCQSHRTELKVLLCIIGIIPRSTKEVKSIYAFCSSLVWAISTRLCRDNVNNVYLKNCLKAQLTNTFNRFFRIFAASESCKTEVALTALPKPNTWCTYDVCFIQQLIEEAP